MQLRNESSTSSECTRKAVWLLVAVALNALEFFIPRLPFFPWLKPGLANCITIIWIIKYGTADAVLYTILRSWISGFYFSFSFLTLSLSLSGGILATLAMGFTWKVSGKRGITGTVGIGIIGAIFHNAGQLAAVYFLVVKNLSVFYQIPFMIAASVLFGSAVGFLVPAFRQILNSEEFNAAANSRISFKGFTFKHAAGSLALLAFCISMLLVQDITVLSIMALLITITASLARRSFKPLLYPARFWPLFLFVFCMYSFFSFGTRLSWTDFLTNEGIRASVLQSLRIWAWLETGLLLSGLRFNEIFLSVLKRFFPDREETLTAGILALESFPEVLRFAKSSECRSELPFFKKPLFSLSEFLIRVQRHVTQLIPGS